MKTIKIEEDFQIPGTNVLLEKGDRIQVQEAMRQVSREELLEWVAGQIRAGKTATWISWQNMPEGGFAGQMSPRSLKMFKTTIDRLGRINVSNPNEHFLIVPKYFDHFGIYDSTGAIHLGSNSVLCSITFG